MKNIEYYLDKCSTIKISSLIWKIAGVAVLMSFSYSWGIQACLTAPELYGLASEVECHFIGMKQVNILRNNVSNIGISILLVAGIVAYVWNETITGMKRGREKK